MKVKVHNLYFTRRDIEVIQDWLEERIDAGHWGDGAVFTEEQESLLKLLQSAKPGLYHLEENQIYQIIHDAEKCCSSGYGSCSPAGSVFEIATLYKLNKAVGKGDEFLETWKVSEAEIESWLREYH